MVFAQTGYSLHVGLNRVNPKFYDGWSGPLAGCENDARDMHSLAQHAGFTDSKILLTDQATNEAVIAGIQRAARDLKAGDFFFFTNSSHGGQIPVKKVRHADGVIVGDPIPDETDSKDETICLYNGEFIDNRFRLELWPLFAAGVRILFFSDSCHSGTVSSLLPPDVADDIRQGRLRIRGMPDDVVARLATSRQAMSDAYHRLVDGQTPAAIGATILLLSGCQDDQNSMDGSQNGLFTEKVLHVWNGGKFTGKNYRDFHAAIIAQMPKYQQPNYFVTGAPNVAYEAQRPFKI